MNYWLRTLGSPALEEVRDGSARVVFAPGKALGVLIYLNTVPGKTASREHLSHLLWRESSSPNARTALRQVVWQIRERLGAGALVGGGPNLTLAAELPSDRENFLQALKMGDLETAVERYAGEFLADFAVPGGADFGTWADGERHRLRSAFQTAGETVVRSRLDQGRFEEARILASRIRDAVPLSEEAWRLVLESAVASGDDIGFALEVEALRSMLEAEGREPEPSTDELLARGRTGAPSAATDERSAFHLTADLIARERVFATLVAGWRQASAGRGARRFHLVGRAGVGKTRLVRELRARLDAEGAQVVMLGAYQAQRKMAYALTGDVIAQLGTRRGALGVSPGAAALLVQMAPSLSRVFHVTGARPHATPQSMRLAIEELLRAVADERPVGLLIDDLHWADPESLAVLAAVSDRLSSDMVLLVTTQRPPSAELPGSTQSIELPPLNELQVHDMIESLGLRSDSWPRSLTGALHTRTGGVPFLILETLRDLVDRGLLSFDARGDWSSSGDLLGALNEGSAERARVERLDAVDFRTMTVLAAAGAPVPPRVLDRVLRMDDQAATRLAALEQGGFVAKDERGIAVAHDALAETILDLLDSDTLAGARKELGTALGRSTTDPEMMRLAASHLSSVGDEEQLSALFEAWTRYWRGRGDRRSLRELGAALLGDGEPAETVRRLLRSLSWRVRVRHATRPGVMAAGLILVGAGLGMAGVRLGASPAYQLYVSSTPFGRDQRGAMYPAPVVEVRHRDGTVATQRPDTIVARVITGPRRVRGVTRVVAVNGRAVFENLVTTVGPETIRGFYVLEFTSSAGTVVTDSFELEYPASLHLEDAVLNGQVVETTRPRIEVEAGDSIVGRVRFRYSSHWAAAAITMGMSPTWEPRESIEPGWALSTPARNALTPGIDVTLGAPRRPGTYHIIFAFNAEETTPNVFSGTNWAYGPPVWHDGNDVHDWSDQQLRQARTRGWVRATVVKLPSEHYPTGIDSAMAVPAAVIDVVIR